MGQRTRRYNLLPVKSTYKCYFHMSLLVFFITFLWVLPWYFKNEPYSKYFVFSSWTKEEISKKVVEQNRKRLEEAKSYLANIDAQNNLFTYAKLLAKPDIDIVIGIITIKRLYGSEEGGYLTQTVTKFDVLFKDGKAAFQNKALFICNTHAGPDKHSEADWLSEYFPMFVRFNETKNVTRNIFDKERLDYMYCLQKAEGYRAKYVLLVEDDALPYPELFSVLKSILDRPVIKRYSQKQSAEQSSKLWAYMKLFYPRKWQGYGNEVRHVLELASIGVIGGGVFAFLLKSMFIQKRTLSIKLYSIAFVIGMVYSVLVAVLVGRQLLLELRRLSVRFWNIVPAPECCTQATLYPNHTISGLLHYLETVQSKKEFGMDLAMDKYVSKHGYIKLLAEPNLFKHIGYISTLRGHSAHPEYFLY